MLTAAQCSGVHEASRRIADAWRLDPARVEAELLRSPQPGHVLYQLQRFEAIQASLRRLHATNSGFSARAFWHEIRLEKTSPAERLGGADEVELLEQLLSELWMAEGVFGAVRVDEAFVERIFGPDRP